ncbi:hypothetical protein QVN02_27930, partial [Klebsiella pneumoniae]|uniref:hypothetical protein n=1 Tax=Klebsiella pneumoniae TaxID=573 RepID=UPI0035240799
LELLLAACFFFLFLCVFFFLFFFLFVGVGVGGGGGGGGLFCKEEAWGLVLNYCVVRGEKENKNDSLKD